MQSSEPLHERLKRLRLEKGLTQRELAEPRFTAAYMSILESGRRHPSPGAITYLAERLGVEYEELATGRPRDLMPRLMLRLQQARQRLSRGERDEARAEAHEVRREAGEHRVLRVEARAIELLALIDERQGRVEDALKLYEESAAVLKTEPLPLRTEAICGQARCLQMMGDLRYAIHLLETHLAVLLRTEMQDPPALMRTYSSLVWPYSEAGLETKASQTAKAALRLGARVEDPAELANMHVNAARSLLADGRPADATRSLERAEELYGSLSWDGEVARAHLARGIVMADSGDLQQARTLMLRSLSLLERSADGINQARALNELAAVERRLGDLDAAREHLNRADDLLRDVDVAELALTRRESGLCYWTGDRELAEKNLREAIDLYERAERPAQAAAAWLSLGDLLAEVGDASGASDSYRHGLRAALGDQVASR